MTRNGRARARAGGRMSAYIYLLEKVRKLETQAEPTGCVPNPFLNEEDALETDAPAAEVVPLRLPEPGLGGPLPLGEFLHVPKAEVVELRRLSPLEEWRAGWQSLRPEVEPCPGFSMGHWPRIHAAGLLFLE